MQLLVTGGMGFIGSNFIHYWLKNHPADTIINFDNLTYAANPASLQDCSHNPRYHFVKGDIVDEVAVDQVMSGTDVVVHFAAESHVDRSIDNPTLFVRTNVLGTYVLLSAALKHSVKRFHHISTDEVFGSVNRLDPQDFFRENRPYNPTSPYAASKASSDHFVRSFFKTFGLPVTISNCSNNYGPFQNPEKFIPRMITNVLNNQKIPVYGQGDNIRDWLYVEDHCSAIDTILNKGKVGETYCIGGLKDGSTNLNLVKTVLQVMGKNIDQINYVPDRPGHDDYRVDWTKINQQLGWTPKHTLEEGIKATIQWYQQNSDWWTNSKKEAELFYQKLNNYQHTSYEKK
ncbi:dTDP-glucose 4,6-dehydratase [Patescibacteria group bacterium]|nr:dTDP-glucose 4,6-dehydratase [Patescibacteria group bacterium]